MNRNFLTAPISSIPVTAVAILSLAAGLSACTSDTDTDALIGVLPDDRVLVNLNTDNVDQAARGDLGDWSDAYLPPRPP